MRTSPHCRRRTKQRRRRSTERMLVRGCRSFLSPNIRDAVQSVPDRNLLSRSRLLYALKLARRSGLEWREKSVGMRRMSFKRLWPASDPLLAAVDSTRIFHHLLVLSRDLLSPHLVLPSFLPLLHSSRSIQSPPAALCCRKRRAGDDDSLQIRVVKEFWISSADERGRSVSYDGGGATSLRFAPS